ncbi:hypothetical protein IDH44_23750 [Paenibacillus sp. IB182496]|uniref:Fimbrial assembly protein n=1 Tax=Paenibacillus sabuli TaxID=2772509 RepID=A0A927GUJ1_9BACL|nr:hypothetical protein [Paenibacillus sabuli]MBD2848220.1 hypothetical protein [Paenibacillus sabuli]
MMASINLAPRTPWLVRYRIWLCLMLGIAGVAAFGLQWSHAHEARQAAAQARAEAAALQTRLTELEGEAEQRTQRESGRIAALELERVRADRTVWSSGIAAVLADLPQEKTGGASSRPQYGVSALAVSESGELTATLYLNSYYNTQAYIGALEQQPLAADTAVDELALTRLEPGGALQLDGYTAASRLYRLTTRVQLDLAQLAEGKP